jgi:hypothetical protein
MRLTRLAVISLLFVVWQTAHGQWVQTNGPPGSTVWSFAVSGTNLSAGADGGAVCLSTDSGASWPTVNSDLANTTVNGLAIGSTNLFLGIVFRSTWRRPLSEMMPVNEPVGGPPSLYALGQNCPKPFNHAA